MAAVGSGAAAGRQSSAARPLTAAAMRPIRRPPMEATTAAALPPLVNEQPDDALPSDGLIERAFGPGRYAKAAERLREGNRALLDLSFVAKAGGEVVGCVRMWPRRIGGALCGVLRADVPRPYWRDAAAAARPLRRRRDIPQPRPGRRPDRPSLRGG